VTVLLKVGDVEGILLGPLEGIAVGVRDGAKVGTDDRDGIGDKEGASDGSRELDGRFVGIRLIVGVIDGGTVALLTISFPCKVEFGTIVSDARETLGNWLGASVKVPLSSGLSANISFSSVSPSVAFKSVGATVAGSVGASVVLGTT